MESKDLEPHERVVRCLNCQRLMSAGAFLKPSHGCNPDSVYVADALGNETSDGNTWEMRDGVDTKYPRRHAAADKIIAGMRLDGAQSVQAATWNHYSATVEVVGNTKRELVSAKVRAARAKMVYREAVAATNAAAAEYERPKS